MERAIKIAQGIVPKLADTLAAMGGHLECTDCGRIEALGDVGSKLSGGWPVCCRYTMQWVTARQLAERAAEKASE